MRIYQPDREFLNAFIAPHAAKCTGKVLDVGGGNGSRYRKFFTSASKFTSLDPDASCRPDIIANAENIPLDDNSVDAVICSEVLMYIFDIEKAINEIARVLRPEGTIILTTSFMPTPAIHDHYMWQPGYTGLQRLLQNNFEKISIEPRGHYHAQMSQNRRRYIIEKYSLYEKRLIGTLFSLISKPFGKWAIMRDQKDLSKGNIIFTMGFNIIATKRK